MIEFVPFKPEHLAALHLQAAQAYLTPVIKDPEIGAALTRHGFAWSARDEDGLLGSAGVLPQWPGRAITWAMLAARAGAYMPAITLRARRILRQAHASGYRRIEATVVAGWEPGMRWVQLLGFGEPEGYLKKYGPDGSDSLIYARVAP